MRPQEIQLFEIVVGIEQRAALGGAGLMIEPERRPLIVHVERACTQQIDQPRQHRPKRPPLQPRALRQRDDRGLGGIGSERAERRGDRIVVGNDAGKSSEDGESGACIAGFERYSNDSSPLRKQGPIRRGFSISGGRRSYFPQQLKLVDMGPCFRRDDSEAASG